MTTTESTTACQHVPSHTRRVVPPLDADHLPSDTYHNFEYDTVATGSIPIEEESMVDRNSIPLMDRPRKRLTEKKARDNLKDGHGAIAEVLRESGVLPRGRAKNVRSLLELSKMKTQKLRDIEAELADVRQTYSNLGFVEGTDAKCDLDVAALCNNLHSHLLTEREKDFKGYFFYPICEACPICTDEFTAQQG